MSAEAHGVHFASHSAAALPTNIMEHEEAAPHAAPGLTVAVVDEELEGAQLSNEESELVEAHRRHCEHIRAVRHPSYFELRFSSPSSKLCPDTDP